MLDSNDLLNIIKTASRNAVEESQPANICFGKVTSASPLKILVEQKMTLGKAQLVLSRNVTDFVTDIIINPSTSSTKQEMKIFNGLKTGDEVILIRQQGGQKYIVLDRVVNK